ncbi:Cytidylate kinase [bioreactor metagenome]|uniref:Cytidylate kinase n=1 Tax=bioreactor metagenome TaxID=1076179 RepID=A0A644W7F8_9ZZZZ
MKAPLIITISRQLGAGGSVIGQQLARRLKINFIDRQIISETAKELSVPESEIESRDEKIQSIWKSMLQSGRFAPDVYIPAFVKYPPTDYQLFSTESEIIRKIAKENSAVIIGRCGFHILSDHPGCVKLFLHADLNSRLKRIQEEHSVTREEAEKMIEESDRKRAHYIHSFTKLNWADAGLYDLSVDTGRYGIENSIELILYYLSKTDNKH